MTSCGPPVEVAADSDISIGSVWRWVRQGDIDDGVLDSTTTTERDELVQLCREERRWSRTTGLCAARRPASPLDRSHDEIPAGP